VRNQGSAVAVTIRLLLLDDASGDRILPTLYEDNYLWLLPGESRTLTVSFPNSALPAGEPELLVKGYNPPTVPARA